MNVTITEYEKAEKIKLEVAGDVIYEGQPLSAVEAFQKVARHNKQFFCHIQVKEGD